MPGVEDEDGHGPEIGLDAVERRLDGGLVADVASHAEDAVVGRRLEVQRRDLGAVAGEDLGDGLARCRGPRRSRRPPARPAPPPGSSQSSSLPVAAHAPCAAGW